jgi:transcriptional regulator with XRE-family HTH domain
MRQIRGDRVKDLRERRGLTQGQLAQYGGASQSYISDIESGKQTNVGSGKLVGIARVLKTNVGYLVGDTDDPRPSDTVWSEIPASKRRVIEKFLALAEQHVPYVESFVDSLLEHQEEPQEQEGAGTQAP